MSKGISLHIGLNYVDPNHYSGWDGKLAAAEYDANDMYLIAKLQGFQPTKLLRSDATRSDVITAIKTASSKLQENDMYLISYSGHGGQIPDQNSEEDDNMDETWCLFDGELVDDELLNLWSNFQKGVRILVISDSCHSGTIIKGVKSLIRPKPEFNPKFQPIDIAQSTYFNNKEFYDNILVGVKNVDSQNIRASIKLISGCQDNQESYDGTFNGQFTSALKRIWNGGKFSGDYLSFHKQIMNVLPAEQSPNYYNIGQPNESFNNQKPFTI